MCVCMYIYIYIYIYIVGLLSVSRNRDRKKANSAICWGRTRWGAPGLSWPENPEYENGRKGKLASPSLRQAVRNKKYF